MRITWLLACLLLAVPIRAQSPVEYVEIERIGRGAITGVYALAACQTLAVTTVRGIWLYQMEDTNIPPRWLDRDKYEVLESTAGEDGTPAPLPYGVYAAPEIAFDPTCENAAVADHTGAVRLIDLETSQVLAVLDADGRAYAALAFNPDGSLLAAAGTHFPPPSIIIDFWDTRQASLRQTISIPNQVAPDLLLFSPNEKYLIVGIAEVGGDYERYGTTIVERASGEVVFSEMQGHGRVRDVPALDMPPLIVNSALYPLRFGDPDAPFTIEVVESRELIPCRGECPPLVVGYDGLLNAHHLSIPELDIAANDSIHRLEHGQLASPRWLLNTNRPNYQPPVLLSLDGSVALPLALPEIARNSTVRTAVFSSDGRWLALAFGSDALGGTYDNVVRIWDVSTDQPDAEPTAVLEHGDTLTALEFSPDSRLLVTASEDKAAYLWNVADWSLGDALLHPADVQLLAFSDDGVILTTYADDGLLRLWRPAQ